MSRVHLIESPVSKYLKFELEAYKLNSKVGENIYLLDKDKYDNTINYDFWLFDDEIVLKMTYDKNGSFIKIEEITKDINKYIEVKNKLLSISIDFKDWK